MTFAYCGIAILIVALLLLVGSLREKRPYGSLALATAAIIFAFFLGDVHYTGKRELALVPCGTAAIAAEQAVPCPFK